MKRTQNIFNTFDNQELFYRTWEQDAPSNGKILILLHRGHEHSGRLESIAAQKAFEGYKIYSYDNRGHGKTKVEATYEFMNLVRDLDAFVAFVCKEEGKKQEDIFVVANSVAGVVASTWVHDYAPKIRGMALVAPAFKIKLYFPFAKEFLKLAIMLKPKLNIKSYVKSKFLTHNVEEQKKYDEDTLITPNIPARQLTTLLDRAQRVVGDAALISTPTLVLSATKDYVVDSAVQGDFYAKLSSAKKRFVKLEGFFHGVLYEEEHQIAIDEIASFMDECFSEELVLEKEKHIDFTQVERDRIAYGSLPLCKEAFYGIQRFSIEKFGFMSKGMSIGNKYGFDSGVTLDHVYANQPEGKTFVGKFMDKNYINSIGWRGIRQRKANMISSVQVKIDALYEEGKEVVILDIAGGPARYLVEIAKANPSVKVYVRDYQEQNVEEGRALAVEMEVENIFYEVCDAFDLASYENVGFVPNIVIVSGVFELFSDNELIANAMKGITQIIQNEGYLLYTGQPWHPQLELIANVLGNHQQEKWIMRRRSQYELDALFGEHGFEKERMLIDDWGIFTVSSAKYSDA
ncbi:MAG: Putative lipase in cluster with Phosphatidate cytidylyltransferase [uncultured Sulfurovum sp.]|uniref:Lipase in cluster with Phosphatidate cytidylyltransferase n=1 Tax=uncultured Sulfurovum sp. TaxID=269237 RepID=A0A6S6SFB9_9BACT|nr:MAG: Putative lipase in cluster with Phosphatidate cytidylyltransferase [uncultured Sulfurovum sp.]